MEKKHDKECEMKIGYQSCDCPRGVKTSGHTPGPWGIREHKGNTGHSFVVAQPDQLSGQLGFAGESPIADIRCKMNGFDEANARLIAAAPELLEALKKRIANCGYCQGNYGPETKDCLSCVSDKTLIAKTEGR